MDLNPWVSAFITFTILTLHVTGQGVRPENVTFNIWEGNVTVTWDPPKKNTLHHTYTVELSNYVDSPNDWLPVPHCHLQKSTTCNIGHIAVDKNCKVRVGVLMPQGIFSWSGKKSINVRNSQLFPPTFSLSSTPYSVQVKVDRKLELAKNYFPFDLLYTVYLRPEGQENQTLSKNDEDSDSKDGVMTFTSLKLWQVYCVRVKVESKSTDARNISTERCIQLPLDVTLIICFVFLGILGLLILLTLLVCCFLRRPQKLPVALKPVSKGWRPMSIGSVTLETVTDKGWFISSSQKSKGESFCEFTEDENERRESLDSGVSMEQLHPSDSNVKTDEHMVDVQEDSGCGSMKGSEGSGSIRSATGELIPPDKIGQDHRSEGREDSGLGLSHHEVSGSLEGADSGLLSEVVVGDGYRSQSPSSVDVQTETPDMDSNVAAPSCGYRSGQVTCMCSDHEYCMWCKSKKPLTENCETQTQTLTAFGQCQSDDGNSVSSYRMKNLIQTVNLLDTIDSLSVYPPDDIDCDESSQFLMSRPLLSPGAEEQTCIAHTLSFTLDDVELTFS